MFGFAVQLCGQEKSDRAEFSKDALHIHNGFSGKVCSEGTENGAR
jgi:hypothetical protein